VRTDCQTTGTQSTATTINERMGKRGNGFQETFFTFADHYRKPASLARTAEMGSVPGIAS
jgi:hypothetical protein